MPGHTDFAESAAPAPGEPVHCVTTHLQRSGAMNNAGASPPFAHRHVVAAPVAREAPLDASTALLAHELRSPLSAIGFAAQLLERPGADAATVARLGALISRQAQQMEHLINEVMISARIVNHALILQRQRLDLRDVLRNAIETVQAEVQRHGHHLAFNQPDKAFWLWGDPLRMEQIFVNLLNNAAKYTEEAGSITVALSRRGDRCIVRVVDTGIGIAAPAMPHLFEPFHQCEPTSPRSRQGLGVGLGWVRRLVELHGGNVSAASAGLGRGSTFTVVLPTEIPVSSGFPL